MPGSTIEFRRVSFTRPGGRVILHEFDLSVQPGEILALVGRSGAGKTTILKLVNRLLLPDAGEVAVEGRPTTEQDPIELRRRLGYVAQDVGLFPHRTVAENVATVPQLAGWPAARIQARVQEMLTLVGLPPQAFAARWPDELSGGQRQRVGVARALAADPPAMLMDEPFGALDPITRKELHQEFRQIQARIRKTVMIVTHDMTEAFSLADRVGVIEEGRLIALDQPRGIASSDDPHVRRLLDSMPQFDGARGSEGARRL